MNIKELKEYIKDLPDDMELARFDSDNQCDKKVQEVTVEDSNISTIGLVEKIRYLNFK